MQEALTNSLKHSGADRAEVVVEYAPASCACRCATTGTAGEREPVDGIGGGHGLIGIRERVKLFDGDLAVGPAPGGGFLVRARLPLGGGS